MKLTKEEVYIDLRGKSKEELTDLYWFLKNNNESLTRERLNCFIEYPLECRYLSLGEKSWNGYYGLNCLVEKTEVTIEQLKEILQPMGTHLLITQDGFKVNEKDNVSWVIDNRYAYELTLCEAHKKLINNPSGAYKVFKDKQNAIKYHDEYLLKNTHIRFESEEEALLYHEAEVKRLKDLINAKDELKRIQKLIESLENES